MKILLLTGDFPPFLSGVGDYTDRLAGSLTKVGAEVTVLTHAGNDDDHPRPYRVLRTMPSFTMRDRAAVIDIAKQHDVINIQYPGCHYGRSPMINLLPTLLRRAAPHLRSVVTIHDFRVMRKRWRLRTWPMLQGVHGILHVDPGDWPAISPWLTLRTPAHACVPIASNVDVVPCTPADRARWRAELDLADDETGVAYFGIMYPHKGLSELLDATRRLRERGHKLRTVVIGDFDREAEWRTAIERRLTSESGVAWVRGATLGRVSECLHACDLAALPFHSGTSVNRSSMLATIGHMLPTVTTDGPVTPKEIRDLFDLILVPPQDSAALEKGIESLLGDGPLRSRMIASARQASSGVTWEAVAGRTLEFFASLMDRSTSRGGAKCA